MKGKELDAQIKLFTTGINKEKAIPLGELSFNIVRENDNCIAVRIQKGVVIDVIKLSQNNFDLIFSYLKSFTNENINTDSHDPDELEHKRGV